MPALVFSKFNKYIYYPDLSNKFLLPALNSFKLPKTYNVYLKYVFSQRSNYSYFALKALMMLSSIFPQRCLMDSHIIVLKYTPARCHSTIYLKVSFDNFVHFINYFNKSPSNPSSVIHGQLKEAKHFIFPGFIKHLRLPHWERLVTISFNQSTDKSLYPLLFHKTAYLD